MSSITVGELKELIKFVPDEYEIDMNIHHRYDISKTEGLKGWYAYINGINIDDDREEIHLMN